MTTSPTAARLRTGIIALGVALTVAVVLVQLQVAPGYRLLLFLPFFVAAVGFFQALYRT